MTESGSGSTVWIADTGLFVACGRGQTKKYTALSRFARRENITFVIPQRVYEELGGAPDESTSEKTSINDAIESGWVSVADELDYTNPVVSNVMDGIQRYIASASNRDEDLIEKPDTALGGLAVQLLDEKEVKFVRLVTTDADAGKGAVSLIEAHGFQDQIEWIDGFELIEEI